MNNTACSIDQHLDFYCFSRLRGVEVACPVMQSRSSGTTSHWVYLPSSRLQQIHCSFSRLAAEEQEPLPSLNCGDAFSLLLHSGFLQSDVVSKIRI